VDAIGRSTGLVKCAINISHSTNPPGPVVASVALHTNFGCSRLRAEGASVLLYDARWTLSQV